MRTRRRLSVLAGAVALLAMPVRAQGADSLAVSADTLAVPADTLALPADSLVVAPDSLTADSVVAVPPRRAVGFAEPDPGAAVTAIPARRPVFSVADLLGALPGAFHYDLGVPGGSNGVAFGGLGPNALSVTLGGVPAHDVFSGRPAWDLLPLDVLAPLRLRPRWGPGGVAADLRAFAAPIPITELRFRTGGTGIQFISATHAQTRRPGWLRRLGGDRARLQALAHVSGREADGDYANVDVRGWQFLARVGLALPAFSVEVTERHGRNRAGAASGVDVATGTVNDPDDRRETIRNDLAATLRIPLLDAPLTTTAFWTAETFRSVDRLGVSAVPEDTLTLRGDRIGLRVLQPFRLGAHRLAAELTGWVERADAGLLFPDPEARTTLHVTLSDSLALGGFGLVLEGGVLASDTGRDPVGGIRAGWASGGWRAYAEVRQAASLESRFARDGFERVLAALPGDRERTLTLDAGLDAEFGPFDVGLGVQSVQRSDPRLLVETDTAATFVSGDGTFRSATGALRLGWRDRARRGLYVRATANAYTHLDADASDLRARLADVLPQLWGDGRLGFRALGLFDDNLDLDLAARGRFWTSFRGRTFQPLAALWALPRPDARPNEAGGTLDLVAEAGIGGGRATVFVLYENVLAGRAYDIATVVPGYPLPGPRLRFGVFWLLPN